jgi:hypothetical protein
MLATSLAFATPALAMETMTPPSGTASTTPKSGYVTFSGLDGSSRMTAVTVGDIAGSPAQRRMVVPYTDSVTLRPGKPPIVHEAVIETGTDTLFRARAEHQGVVTLDVSISTLTLRSMKHARVPGSDATIDLPDEVHESFKGTLSIADGETVPLFASTSGKPLGTLTWNTMPFTTPTPN